MLLAWAAVQSLKNEPQNPSREVLRDYLVLLQFTGPQRNESLCLRWENVDLKRGSLCVVDTKNGSDHVLPMGTYLWELMRRRHREGGGDWVFTNPLTGGRITDPHRQIVNVIAISGVPFSPHDLRRTFASIVGRLGDRLSYYTIKRLLNHRTSDVTQGYVRFDLEQLRSAMQAVEDFVLQAVTAERAGTMESLSEHHDQLAKSRTESDRFTVRRDQP